MESWIMLILWAYCVLSFQKYFQKYPYSRLWHIRWHNFGLNWIEIAHLSQKSIFGGKIDKCYLILAFVPYYIKVFHQSLWREPWGIRLFNFRPDWLLNWLFVTKEFLKKLTSVILVHLLCFVMLKRFSKMLTSDHEIEDCLM